VLSGREQVLVEARRGGGWDHVRLTNTKRRAPVAQQMCTSSSPGVSDISPPAECVNRSSGTYEAKRKYHGSNLIDFEDLIGADMDPAALFTCARQYPAVPARARYTATTQPIGAIRQLPALSFSHIGIGMPVAGTWVTGKMNAEGSMDMRQRCAAGERLACARITWMAAAGPTADVLVLADCSKLRCTTRECELERKISYIPNRQNIWVPKNGRAAYGPYLFDRASWLGADAKLPSLHLRCYWGAYAGLGLSYRKTATLFHALSEQLARKHIYIKVDADAIVRPDNLLRFLDALHRTTVPNSAFYFGSTFGTFACTGIGDQCRAFTFNKGFRGMKTAIGGKKPKTRLRESAQWNALQREMLTPAGDRLANQTAVRYALGGVYGMSGTALARLIQSNCQHRVARLSCGGSACVRSVGSMGIHTHEDANVGLCMHLNGVRMVQCGCFHMMNFVDPSPARRSWSIPPRVDVGSANSVKAFFKDDRPDNSRAPQLCQHPIAVHPIKYVADYMRVWQGLATRDALHDDALHSWQQSVLASRAPQL
jgi:hypothetical protein